MSHFVDRLTFTVFAELYPRRPAAVLLHKVMGYEQASLKKIFTDGLTPQYVTHETKTSD